MATRRRTWWWLALLLVVAALPIGLSLYDRMRTPTAAERAEQVDECLRSQQTRGEDFNYIAVCLVERFGWDESTAALEAFKWSVPR